MSDSRHNSNANPPNKNLSTMGNGTKKSTSGGHHIARAISAVRRTPSVGTEGSGVQHVPVTDPSLLQEALKDLRISHSDWKKSRQNWAGKARKLDGYEVMELPEYFQRTAVLGQYMSDSLLVLYTRKNSKGKVMYKVLEYTTEHIWDFPERDDLDDALGDYCDKQGFLGVKGKITIPVEGNGKSGKQKTYVYYL